MGDPLRWAIENITVGSIPCIFARCVGEDDQKISAILRFLLFGDRVKPIGPDQVVAVAEKSKSVK